MISARFTDKNVWNGELLPAMYSPTDRNFRLYKPNQVRAARVFGHSYYPALLRHPSLADSVLEQRSVEYVIDGYGLRNADEPSSARIFALGDSFCFGYRVPTEAAFTEVLKSRLGQPVYNLGVVGSSPPQQILLLDYLLRAHPGAFNPGHLLWLIYEGNDLEDDAPIPRARTSTSLTLKRVFEGTVIGELPVLASVLRQQSVIRALLSGELTLTGPGETDSTHYELDGERLLHPLYYSPRFGQKFFYREFAARAAKSSFDVLNHPNLPRVTDAFRRMRVLASEQGFDVTVVIAPTAIRLYHDSFEDLPPVSEEPHFIRYIERLSDELGFASVNLHELLAPYAESELLYFRDDTHWNERGNEIAAELVARHVFHD